MTQKYWHLPHTYKLDIKSNEFVTFRVHDIT